MTTTRQQIAARRNPPAGVASLKADNRADALAEILRRHFGFNPTNRGLPILARADEIESALEAAFEAGRRYPARGAKGRAR